MKLANYELQGRTRLGVVLDSSILDLASGWEVYRRSSQDGDMDTLADGSFSDMLTFLQSGTPAWEAAMAVAAWSQTVPPGTFHPEMLRPLDDVRLAAPIENTSKIICVGLNYYDHCREQGIEAPKSPILFVKFPSAIIASGDLITWPTDISQQVDFEAELALVIKNRARNVPSSKAYDYVAGYTIANDVSARDVQFADGQWVRGKSFDTFCPLGPYLVTQDEISDPHNLAIRCRLNGELMQNSNTSEMIFKIPELISFISQTCTLLPGDIICTGTPHGVGVFRDPPIFLKSGDAIDIEIEKLGELRNLVE